MPEWDSPEWDSGVRVDDEQPSAPDSFLFLAFIELASIKIWLRLVDRL